jgi:hypothetical protein
MVYRSRLCKLRRTPPSGEKYEPASPDINNTVKMIGINKPIFFKTVIDDDLNYYSTTENQPHSYKA